MRANGILLPVASLPSKYGIGCFSKEAFEFVDQLKEAGQTYWQILPMGPTGYGDSPYQAFSTFAGNPYFIDPVTLYEDGLVSEEDLKLCELDVNPAYIEYGDIYKVRFQLLKIAYSNFEKNEEYRLFIEHNQDWLKDYSLFMAIKNSLGGSHWTTWPEELKMRDPLALAEKSGELAEEIDFVCFQQYQFLKQYNKLKQYANKNNVLIIGDIPIYVASDSSDVWANPELFQLDEEHLPKAVAGCPPDAFSEDGQLWGNPLYDWDYHKKTGYAWWIRRLRHCFYWYDKVRIDHFRGFDEYFSIPYGDKTAKNGHWEAGPGIALFQAIRLALGDLDLIAEDLGYLTPSVLELLKETGYPGMKVLQFAFDGSTDNSYLPGNFIKNCVVYTGTHDNDTTLGWARTMSRTEKAFLHEYLGLADDIKEEEYPRALIRTAMSSVADLAIIPMQDILKLGGEARVNFPSTTGNNWKWRMLPGQFTKSLRSKLYRMTQIYSRLGTQK